MTNDELDALHLQILRNVDAPLEDLVATVRGQGGTTRAMRVITWDPSSSPTMPALESLPDGLVRGGMPFLPTIATRVVEDLKRFDFSVPPETAALLEQPGDETGVIVITIGGGVMNVVKLDFPIVGAAGGDA